ncbi:hypothetical protein BV898_16261 [Hypsibius exemplaris]|uniref:Uncharacterized protein n=1 Tax=Hypsibius exemplaris TaxID=2072580 RepID=A0A9X6NCU7_HYPEX|nr:hypothetical protein BV898_16261 [Hypsibius exemplaris]
MARLFVAVALFVCWQSEIAKTKYSEDGEKLVADVSIPTKGKTIRSEYEVQGDQLIKTYKTGDIVAKKWFKKVANPTEAPAQAA